MFKTTKQIRVDAEKLTIKEDQQTPDQAASTEMQVFEALRRRGVALAFADLLSWQVHMQEAFVSSFQSPQEGRANWFQQSDPATGPPY